MMPPPPTASSSLGVSSCTSAIGTVLRWVQSLFGVAALMRFNGCYLGNRLEDQGRGCPDQTALGRAAYAVSRRNRPAASVPVDADLFAAAIAVVEVGDGGIRNLRSDVILVHQHVLVLFRMTVLGTVVAFFRERAEEMSRLVRHRAVGAAFAD